MNGVVVNRRADGARSFSIKNNRPSTAGPSLWNRSRDSFPDDPVWSSNYYLVLMCWVVCVKCGVATTAARAMRLHRLTCCCWSGARAARRKADAPGVTEASGSKSSASRTTMLDGPIALGLCAFDMRVSCAGCGVGLDRTKGISSSMTKDRSRCAREHTSAPPARLGCCGRLSRAFFHLLALRLTAANPIA